MLHIEKRRRSAYEAFVNLYNAGEVMMETLAKVVDNTLTPTGGVFVLSFVVLVMGIPILTRLGKDSPLAGNALQVLAIILLVPAAMYLGVTRTINAEAVTGIFGGIAGYVFARAGTVMEK